MEFMTSLRSGVDEQKPSLFELLSEQQLSSLLTPTLRYLLALATARHPRYLIRILNNFDECHAGLFILIERFYLKNYGGSFTEHFYGLKRERVLQIKGGEAPRAQLGAAREVRDVLQLRESDIWRNLAVLIGVPWLKRKLDDSYELNVPTHAAAVVGGDLFASGAGGGPSYRRNSDFSNSTGWEGWKKRLKWYWIWFLRNVYPHINAAYFATTLAFQLAYLFDASKYSSPLLWLVGTRIRRMGEADYRAIALAEDRASAAAATAAGKKSAGRPGQGKSIFEPRIMVEKVGGGLLGGLRWVLPTSIFALKFLEWWHASDFARQLSRKVSEGLELPVPVSRGQLEERKLTRKKSGALKNGNGNGSAQSSPNSKGEKGVQRPPVSASTGLPILTVSPPDMETGDACPICLQRIQTATASPYGYVYCYTCIHRWIEGTHDRQEKFMSGEGLGPWGEDTEMEQADGDGEKVRSREGEWESGKGRDAVTGRRVLGGTEGLRRVVV